jgi:hypothetical protein
MECQINDKNGKPIIFSEIIVLEKLVFKLKCDKLSVIRAYDSKSSSASLKILKNISSS